MRAALGNDDAVVSFLKYDSDPRGGGSRRAVYSAFVTRRTEPAVAFVPLAPADVVDGLVSRWRDALARTRPGAARPDRAAQECARAGRELRGRVWDPVAPALGGARRVFLVPDGALHLVSFAALPTGGGRYVVESGPLLHYVSAERDLVDELSPIPGRGLLALGDPDFDQGRPSIPAAAALTAVPLSATAPHPRAAGCAAFEKLRFAPLPASGQEVDDLEGRFDPARSRRLRGGAATETAVKADAAGRRVLHLATHAFFLGDDCPSALTSAGPGGAAAPGAQAPLLRAGLALAGANQRTTAADMDDGLLTAEEVASLDLRGLEWAVLSACGTGLGQVDASDGVLGLGRAFRVAGVATTIMSLWEVDDESTRRFMRALYRARFLEGRTTDEAVQAATLGALRERRARGRRTDPVYWAAFIASGSWR